MMRRTQLPIALTVAGSDSGGGAGVQADLKTFAALGLHGTCAVTCLTAQNPVEVTGIQAARTEIVRQQIEAVFREMRPAATKTGMLYSERIVHAVAATLRANSACPLVVDPVMVSTSGARLLKQSAVKVLCRELLPLATLLTPNLHEAAILLDRPISSPEELRWAAHRIHDRYGCAVLVKGGHLRGIQEAIDIYYDGKEELLLSADFVKEVSTHGTGCTYSAAVTGYLARGLELPKAVCRAKEHITAAIAHSVRVGRHFALNPMRVRADRAPPSTPSPRGGIPR